MSSIGTSSGHPPVRFADIVFVNGVLDPNGQNPKTRRVVLLTPDDALAAGYPIIAAAITGSIPDPLTSDYVLLPYKNPPGTRHPKTGLTKKAAVLCTWLIKIDPEGVSGRSGFVPAPSMAVIEARTALQAKSIGGWP